VKALLDTHTFLWWNLDSPQLSATARDFIRDGGNEIYLSAASVWEIAVKYGRNRLELPEVPRIYIANRLARHHFVGLPIQINHATHVHTLPQIHTDPFDRIIVAQSQLEGLPLLTADSTLQQYEVTVIW
jgi:PIN domain nuclease of toxin-antitoxin system